MLKRSIALFACLSLFFTCLVYPAGASPGLPTLPDFSITQEQWNDDWQEFGNINTNVCLTPGSEETQLNFAWHSNPADGLPTVKMSKNPNMSGAAVFTGTVAPADGIFNTSRVTATGMEPLTKYYYTYGNANLVFGPFVYRTLAWDSFKFLYVNDLHAGFNPENDAVGRDKAYKIHATIDTALKLNPDISFMIAGGDQTDSGAMPQEWNGLLTSPVFRSLPASFAIGNHDKKGVTQKYYINNPNEYNALLPSPVGKENWFRYGDVLFLLFDSTNGNAADHLNFAKNAINKNLDAKWRIGVIHNDINSPGFGFLDMDNNLIRIIFTTIFDRAGLDVLLNAHSHIYGRSHFLQGGKIADWGFGRQITNPQGTTYISMSAVNNVARQTLPWQNIWTAKRCRDDITTYSTFEVNEDSLKFKAFYENGQRCDAYTIKKTVNDSKPFEEPAGLDLYSIVKLGGFIYTVIDMIGKMG